MSPPWSRDKTVPLLEDNKLNLNVLSPKLVSVIKSCIGKLERDDFSLEELKQSEEIVKLIPGEPCQLFGKGLFDHYGAPIEKLKALPPNKKRK